MVDSDDSLSRRNVLKCCGATGVVGAAGCLGDDGDDGGASEAAAGFPDFDPSNPQFPQTAQTLISEEWDFGDVSELDDTEPRDEPRYGGTAPEASEDEYAEPDPLVFTWAPTEDPAGYADTFDLLRENLEAELDREVESFIVDDYAAQVEAMRADRLHLARFATGNTPFGVNIAGAVPMVMPVQEGGLYGTKSWLIAQTGNDDVNGVEDVEGLEVAMGSAGSNSGTLAPQALWEQDHGLVADEDYDYELTGGHEQATLSVYQGDHEAGTVCSHCFKRAMEGRDLNMEEIKIVWSSDTFPLGPFSYRYNLHPDIVDGIRTALMDYDYTDTALHEDLGYNTFTEIDYATHWDQVLAIQEFNEVEYTEQDL